MGSSLVRGFIERGENVRVVILPNDPLEHRLDGLDVDIRYGDISDASTLETVCEGVDTVYHLAAVLLTPNPEVFQKVNVQGTRNMIDASVAAGVNHFIYVSSISVTYPHATAYSMSKREGERMIKEQTAMNYTIVRPTLAYGPDGGIEFMKFMEMMLKMPIVPMVGMGAAMKNPVHVSDMERGMFALWNNPNTYGKTYPFSGSEEISMWAFARLILKHRNAGWKLMVPVPVPVLRAAAWILGQFMKNPPVTWQGIAGLSQDANPDWQHNVRDFGYNPIGVHEGMQRSFPIDPDPDCGTVVDTMHHDTPTTA